jgi:hypothetical protein
MEQGRRPDGTPGELLDSSTHAEALTITRDYLFLFKSLRNPQ